MLEICSAICRLAPVPTATMAITAPTPMMMPSMVRAERILFTRSARKEILKVEGMLIIILVQVAEAMESRLCRATDEQR